MKTLPIHEGRPPPPQISFGAELMRPMRIRNGKPAARQASASEHMRPGLGRHGAMASTRPRQQRSSSAGLLIISPFRCKYPSFRAHTIPDECAGLKELIDNPPAVGEYEPGSRYRSSDGISGLRMDAHAKSSAGAHATRACLRCSLPQVHRTSNTGTNVIP